MTTLNIQTNASKNTIKALKDLIYSIDPEAYIEDENGYLSKEDEEDLRQIVEKNERVELEFLTIDEMKERSREYLKTLENLETNASKSTIKALKDLIYSIDPDYTEDESGYLSKQDKEDLRQIVEKSKRGELEFLSESEFSEKMAQKGYEW